MIGSNFGPISEVRSAWANQKVRILTSGVKELIKISVFHMRSILLNTVDSTNIVQLELKLNNQDYYQVV